MLSDSPSEVKFEIGHVLFIDIVGYSKLLINQQSEQIQTLRDIVRGTEQFRLAETEGKLVRLPTGDGGALVFRTSPEAPVLCAIEISKELKRHPELHVRMGIHSGPVNAVTDLNEQANIAGAGINIAKRVMDCGDAGHILLSKHVAEDLEHYPRWQPYLHDLGECEVKHGVRVSIVDLYTDDAGNAALPTCLAAQKRSPAKGKQSAGFRTLLVVAAIIIGLGVPALIFTPAILKSLRSPISGDKTASSSIPDKSIAVLPFENRSRDPDNAYFTDGVQDEILTDLAKIADLKVISRTSVMQYKTGVARNLRKISEELGVAHVVEGSVQRAANKVRVNAQLLDARTDAHLWAQTYDRDLADVFAIQSEIAKAIADQLQAKLSPKEVAGLQAKPTKDLIAYDLYLHAREIGRNMVTNIGVSGVEWTEQQIPLLEAAVQRDPAFVPALCELAHAHLYLYWQGIDRTPARLAQAERVLDEAARLQPDSGEVHFARSLLLYWIRRDYESALKELTIAGRELPNDARIPYWIGLIKRRQGKWEEARRQMEQAITDDPRNLSMISEAAGTYFLSRHYREAAKLTDSALAWNPIDFGLRQLRANIDMLWKANLGLWKDLIVSKAAQAASAGDLASTRFELAMLERDYHTAEQVLASGKVAEFENSGFFVPKEWNRATIARGLGDEAKATAQLQAARERAAAKVREQPDNGQALIVLAQIEADLGHNEDAIREGQRALELLPVAKDSIIGADIAYRLAGIYTRVGATTRAFELLEELIWIPNGASYGSLKLREIWDPLRHDPRFEKILVSIAPKEPPK